MGKKKILIKDTIVGLVLCLCISIFLEVFLFNFRYWQSLNFKQIENYKTSYSKGLQVNTDGTFSVLNGEDAYIEFFDINDIIKNIKIDIEAPNNTIEEAGLVRKYDVVDVTISATDKANKDFFSLPETNILHSNQRTQYIFLNLSGESEKIRVNINNLEGQSIIIHDIAFNAHKAIQISSMRVFVLFIILAFLFFYRYNSRSYKWMVDAESKAQKIIICMVIAVQLIFWGYLGISNTWCVNPPAEHHQQYQALAHSLKEGHFYLDQIPSDTLKNLENPYDRGLRKEFNVDGEGWDQAYFEGKFYVYFGIVPELLTYFPYYLITGKDLPNIVSVFIGEILFVCSVMFLMFQFVKSYFKKIPFLTYLFLSVVVINCGGIYISGRPDFYSAPIIFGAAFTCLGLGLWIKSSKDPIKRKVSLLLGSFCMALVAGCRPQMLMGSFFCIPIFTSFIRLKNDNKLIYKDKIKTILFFILPYILVAVFIMYYNYVRFGSIVDFGANYNLTGNDMTKRGFVFARIFLGLFSYLFQPINFTGTFPFLKQATMTTTYQGLTISEWMYGGTFATNLLLWFCCLYFYIADTLKKKKIFIMGIFSFVSAIVIVIADTQMAGILTRYTLDYCIFLYIPALSVILSLFEKSWEWNESNKKLLKRMVTFGGIISLALCFFLVFRSEREGYLQYNPMLYYTVKSLFQFW
ncbi:hypothetical protein [Eubacterium callanderi]|uniref:hypothetical protein n=1 Tax=Eubacterium callanderi TaxID=53442 RepID=UPI00399B7E44